LIARAVKPLRYLSLLLLSLAAPAQAQTIDDGIMLEKRTLFTGYMYSYDSWDLYWEGALKRDNGNIGTVTTQANAIFGNYALSDRLNIIAIAPYVWTRASQGVLRPMEGFQDITLAVKASFLEKPSTRFGSLKGIVVASGGIPLTDYTPDFAPLSIGSGSTRVAARGTINLVTKAGWYTNGSSSYTWRANVTLDRPYYYTNGQLFFSDQVDMPNVFDYVVTSGLMKHRWMLTGSFWQQRTLGGGDIRRQDMPFVSNRMNFSRIGAMLMAPIPKVRRLSGQVAYGYTVSGRNVGQATSVTAGLMYTMPARRRSVR
jgi:hypothetical protein